MACPTRYNANLVSNRRAHSLAICCLAGVFAQAATLPEGPGKAETTRICGKCHSLDQATSVRLGNTGWSETITKMINLGAEGSEAEFTTILNYLVKNYPGRGTNTGPAATPSSPADTA